MASLSPNDLFDAFVKDGNQLLGPRPTQYIGAFEMSWRGSGCVLELQEGVIFSSAQLRFTSGGGTIRIEKGATVKGRLEVNGGGSIRIGEGTFLNRVCDILGGEGASVDIGKNCLFSDVRAQTSDMHSIIDIASGKRTNPAAGIVIEDEVWIAEQVKIAKGVRIGTGAVIAAGSLVTRSVAPFCIAGGRPAKILKTGVSWSRQLKKMPPLPAPDFEPLDIPLEKEVLRYLMGQKKYALVEAVILAADQATLPLYARWYLVSSKHKLGRPHPDAMAMLDDILEQAPSHSAARALRDSLGAKA